MDDQQKQGALKAQDEMLEIADRLFQEGKSEQEVRKALSDYLDRKRAEARNNK
ncbi:MULTISPECIES: hypothetical protein [Pontibacillus]|uniref:Uncharacterized protein n=1 Tax=Pontibacillus chungwhensis TaxID=265426 RepID=A0ABY8UZC7_9BACI|nr:MULTISPECIES: hypothetical protein [Pontibacillus]MCD5324209.1 hypothetical protein [Pontibacillus sp. HN14]WIF97734.1 hypothetical protein QNI29_18715 [Pontibacillus chungwhensis]